MKAKVIYPTDVKVYEESKQFNSVESDTMELKMSETSLCHYKMRFKKNGNGMNVWIEEDVEDGETISSSKNFECMCRKLILAEKIISNINLNALQSLPMFNKNQSEEDKTIAKALECASYTIDNYISGHYNDLTDTDIELICKAAAYKKMEESK